MRKSVLAAVALTAGLMTAASAAAQGDAMAQRKWDSLGSWNGNQYWIDNSSVERSGNSRLFWSKVLFPAPNDKIGGANLVYTQYRLDCAAGMMQLRRFRGLNPAGATVMDEDMGESRSSVKIAPDSANSQIQTLLCG